MNFVNYNDNICRICLDENVFLNWNNIVSGCHDVSYKDCFYKYTLLECPAQDQFSQMLCQTCCNGLTDVHTLISKALESYKYFQRINSAKTIEIDVSEEKPKNESVREEKDIVKVLLEESEDNSTLDDLFVYGEEFIVSPVENKLVTRNKKGKKNLENLDNRSEKLTLDEEISNEQETHTKKRAGLKKVKKYPIIRRMCSFCSKILHSKYSVQMHEKTHMDNRERKETCKECGLKFYDKQGIYSHMRVHKQNRTKEHKCDFCNKSFYYKGDLNVHRRKHLGQMVPCSLCTKQFYTKIDLEKHMNSHSATALNASARKKSKYLVRCKLCDKSIRSTSFKSHTAAHLNEPLMKCSICNREYFSRNSCNIHLKKIHQKTQDEYKDCIIEFNKKRLSHLFLKLEADMQSIDE